MPQPQNTNTGAQNPLTLGEDKNKIAIRDGVVPNVPYSDPEKAYIGYLQNRLQVARDIRNQNHDEFDGMTYMQYYESNLKGANSYIAPKKNKEDTTFVTGSTRQALLAMCAQINKLNLSPEVRAFDKNNHEDVHTGQAMGDILFKAGKLDNDEEKQLLRQYELYSQGTVFVEEIWQEYYRTEKKYDTKSWDKKTMDMTFEAINKLVDARCTRNLLPGPNVFLGSFTEMEQHDQPYLYTVDYVPYDFAKAIFQDWERWKYVTHDVRSFSQPVPQSILYNNWRLQQTQQEMCEIIKYQDLPGNEYQIILNGVLMLPIGFPLPWTKPDYSIIKQINEIITPYCAYGGSLIKRLKGSQALEDEFWRLAILKSQKSFLPSLANMSGKILSSRMFMPGKIVNGVSADQVKPFLDSAQSGVTPSEFQMMSMLKNNIYDNSLPQITQQPGGDKGDSAAPVGTTTQVMNQAKVLLGLAIFAAVNLEKKLAEKRISDILENWFETQGTEVDDVKEDIRNKYRSISVDKTIPGEGKGRKMVKLTDSLPDTEDIYNEEEDMQKNEGKPVRITYLSPKEVKSTIQYWYVEVNPRERDSSDLSKVLFGNMLQGMTAMGALAQQAPNVNMDFVQERFAEVWDLPADKAFTSQAKQALGGQQMTPPQGSQVPPGNIASQMKGGAVSPVKQMQPSLNQVAQ